MTTRQKLIEARNLRNQGELAEARHLELLAMDELIEREYRRIDASKSTIVESLIVFLICALLAWLAWFVICL